jgi:hypothetical protein
MAAPHQHLPAGPHRGRAVAAGDGGRRDRAPGGRRHRRGSELEPGVERRDVAVEGVQGALDGRELLERRVQLGQQRGAAVAAGGIGKQPPEVAEVGEAGPPVTRRPRTIPAVSSKKNDQ